ncbi:MAG: chorismate-binding protein [Salinivirgaceae bacterium]|nr:chorismate-binding protein [Salinivirgaceae bacterium]
MNTDISFIPKAINCGIPFAIWREPRSNKIQITICNPNDLVEIYSYTEIDKNKGFVFAPFDACKHLPIYIIPFTAINDIEFNCVNKGKSLIGEKGKFNFNLKESEIQHIKQVNRFLEAFSKSNIKKAVLSRNKWIDGYQISQMPELFQKLDESYPNAFVYQVYIPNAGYWVGATPELLFATNNGTASTVSLAGTQQFSDHITWDKKEAIEQELVTKHIRNVLYEFGIHDYNETGPETAKAGKLAHLKTQIEFNRSLITRNFGRFIEKLHPTPAICGLPVKESLELIFQTETFDREYYCGFLGPFNPDERSNLFVNLRCLQAFENGVALYGGGGITPDSDPEKEWEETRLKIQTLENILETL